MRLRRLLRRTLFWGLCLPAVSWALTCTFAWEPPITNADGTPITDLAGYRLYTSAVTGQYGTPAHDLPLSALATPTVPRVTVPCEERSFWVVTAYDSWTPPNESARSNEVQVADRRAPGSPALQLLEIIIKLGPSYGTIARDIHRVRGALRFCRLAHVA